MVCEASSAARNMETSTRLCEWSEKRTVLLRVEVFYPPSHSPKYLTSRPLRNFQRQMTCPVTTDKIHGELESKEEKETKTENLRKIFICHIAVKKRKTCLRPEHREQQLCDLQTYGWATPLHSKLDFVDQTCEQIDRQT